MDFLTALWLPILVSGVAVWFASALFWMAIGHHNKDTQPIPGEEEFIQTLSRLGVKPGNYGFPDFQACKKAGKGKSRAECAKLWDEVQARPWGLLRVWKPTNMGLTMFLTFLFYLVTSAVIAYLGWAALPHLRDTGNMPRQPGLIAGYTHATFSHIFQVLGTAGVLAYCFASFPNDLWFQKSRRAMLMNLIDGVVFGLLTGAIFAWLWPH